ncbi:MAG: ATP synthase F1 subunit epsilon [Ruminococcus sp.]
MAKKTFRLELLASDRPFFVGECEHLVYPAGDGLMGILPGHETLVTVIEPGEIKYKVDGEWRYCAISEGFAEVRKDYVLILGDAIELPDEIDVKRAEEAAERAREQIEQKQGMMQYYQTQAALNRAMNRLKISRKHNHEI